MSKKIHIIDYGFGNLASVQNALEYLNIKCEIIKDPKKLKNATHIILPGVGSFEAGISALKKSGWFEKIQFLASQKTYLLGICLGMQLLFTKGTNEKNGKIIDGLGLISGSCKKFFNQKKKNLPLPHVGFSEVSNKNSKLWKNINSKTFFYFVHTYRISNAKNIDTFNTAIYGEKFISFIEKSNVFGAQFHPEKSQKAGLQLLKNFCNLK